MKIGFVSWKLISYPWSSCGGCGQHFLGGMVDLAMIFSILTWKDLPGFDNNHVLAKLPDHCDTKHSRHLKIPWKLLKTSKITTLNCTKGIELRETHINRGDTMIKNHHAPALIESWVMAEVKELSDLSGPTHCDHVSTISLYPWHYKTHVPLAH